MEDYFEERAIDIGVYTTTNNATLRQIGKTFGISKIAVHVVEQYRMIEW